MISANNDREIGNLIADAMEAVGNDGVITVEEGKTAETTYEVVEGMQFDKGYLSPYFINDMAEMKCTLEDAYILLYEKKISNIRNLVPLLEKVTSAGKQLFIIAEDADTEALTMPSSISSAACSTCARSRRLVLAIVARRCCRILRFSPARKSSAKILVSSWTASN